MTFICYAGGTEHRHERAAEGRDCYSRLSAEHVGIIAAASDRRVERAASEQLATLSLKELENLMEAGVYAVVDPEDDRLKCYKVDKPDQGKWQGWTFLKVHHSDDMYPCKNPTYRRRVFFEILKDAEAAGRKYAEIMKKCRKCGRAIHDQDNPYYEQGYGPECGSKI